MKENIIYYEILSTTIGEMTLLCDDACITRLEFGRYTPEGGKKSLTPLLEQAIWELQEYLNGTRREFDLPLAPMGTAFQKTVWQNLISIPYGETRSYSEIARLAGNPKACRAVGMANNRNPIPIIIPCHRVIGKNGSLVGYGGGLDIKEWLLKLEGIM